MTIERVRVSELMDRADVDDAELARGLRDLRWVNKWLLGAAPAVDNVLRLARRVPDRTVRILDVGTGAADIPLRIVRRARRRGVAVRILATDLHPTTLRVAAAAVDDVPEIEVAKADALALQFGDGEFDITMCNTMLHHLDPADAVRAVRELGRVARWGVVLTDLRRSRLALLATQALAATLWRHNPVTRHDGPASIRASYSPAELADIAREALADPFRVRRHPLFRQSLVVDRTIGARHERPRKEPA